MLWQTLRQFDDWWRNAPLRMFCIQKVVKIKSGFVVISQQCSTVFLQQSWLKLLITKHACAYARRQPRRTPSVSLSTCTNGFGFHSLGAFEGAAVSIGAWLCWLGAVLRSISPLCCPWSPRECPHDQLVVWRDVEGDRRSRRHADRESTRIISFQHCFK